jgi:hypothetical protein
MPGTAIREFPTWADAETTSGEGVSAEHLGKHDCNHRHRQHRRYGGGRLRGRRSGLPAGWPRCPGYPHDRSLGGHAEAVSLDEAFQRADVLLPAVWFDVFKQLITQYGEQDTGPWAGL